MIGAIRCLLQRVSGLPVFPPPPLQGERGVDSHPSGHRVLHPDAAQLEGVGQGHKGSLEDTPRRHPGPDQTWPSFLLIQHQSDAEGRAGAEALHHMQGKETTFVSFVPELISHCSLTYDYLDWNYHQMFLVQSHQYCPYDVAGNWMSFQEDNICSSRSYNPWMNLIG